jgi:thioredoxin-related protein
MKKSTVLLFAIIFLSGIIYGQAEKTTKIRWYSLPEAMELNKKAPRKILIDLYTDWCGWCKKMDAETFEHPVIADYLNAKFYPVKFNAETRDTLIFGGHKFINEGQGARSTHQFAIAIFQAQNMQPGYPSIAYFDENFQLIRVWSGFWTAPQIEVWLHYVVDEKYKPQPLEEYQKTFKSNIITNTQK